MEAGAFDDNLVFIQGLISIFNNTAGVLVRTVVSLATRSQGDGPNVEEAAPHLEETQDGLDKIRTKIDALKEFLRAEQVVQVKGPGYWTCGLGPCRQYRYPSIQLH